MQPVEPRATADPRIHRSGAAPHLTTAVELVNYHAANCPPAINQPLATLGAPTRPRWPDLASRA